MVHLKQVLFVVFMLVFYGVVSCQNVADGFPNPAFHSGVARIEGQLINFEPKAGEQLTICIGFNQYATGEEVNIETKLDASNKFVLDVPLDLSTAIVGLNLYTESTDYGWFAIGLDQSKPLKLTIGFYQSSVLKIVGIGGLGLLPMDIMHYFTADERFDGFSTWDDYSTMTPEAFVEKTRHGELEKRLAFAMPDSFNFSNPMKRFMQDDFTLRFLKGRVLNYKKVAEQDFSDKLEDKLVDGTFTAQEPKLSSYSFLKEYDLNNPKYVYSFYYSDFLERFMSIPAFKIPSIADATVEDWLSIVKTSIKTVIGFESGLFYDMLVAKAYSLQLKEQHIPFSKSQIDQIRTYFRTRQPFLGQRLIQSNDALIRQLEQNKDVKICDVPRVAEEDLMAAILARYVGQVVLVDFWATWCGPCMRAHKAMEPVKNALKSKGVKFVYFTNTTSPKATWKETIKEIGGDHYYLSDTVWRYLMNSYRFEGIPSYLIIDKEGIIKNKHTGFPGTDYMKYTLEELNK